MLAEIFMVRLEAAVRPVQEKLPSSVSPFVPFSPSYLGFFIRFCRVLSTEVFMALRNFGKEVCGAVERGGTGTSETLIRKERAQLSSC